MDVEYWIKEWVRLEEVGIEIAQMYNAELDKVKKEGLISVHIYGLAERYCLLIVVFLISYVFYQFQ